MLQPLYPPTPIAIAERHADVIVIPGLGTLEPKEWVDGSKVWLENLFEDTEGRVQIWNYKYFLKSPEDSILPQLLEEGRSLVACLDTLCAERNSRRRPLLFVCHSLGGVILKKAFCVIRDHHFKHLNVSDVISGMFFLGTPHLPLKVPREPNIMELIIRCTRQRALPRNALVPDSDNALLAKLSHEFKLKQDNIPIVSGYEGRESKVYKGTFAKFRKPHQITIITEGLCAVGSPNENCVQVDSSHNDMCKVTVDGPLYPLIRDALRNALSNFETLVTESSRTSIPDGLEGGTLRSQSAIGPGSVTSILGRRLEIEPPQRPVNTPSQTGDATKGSSTDTSIEIVYLPISFDVVKKDPRLPCFSVRIHEKKADFFGRSEILVMIDSVFLPNNSAPSTSDRASLRSFALCGMGGIGKTQVAVEYVYSRRKKFDAIFWVSADDKNILAEEFARIAVHLGLADQKEAQDLPVACELVKGWLSNPMRSYESASDGTNEASWLLVFDNVDDFEVLEGFWPSTGIGSVLITSRDPLAKTQTYTAHQGVDLGPFSIPEATEFIKSLTLKNVHAGQEKYLMQIADKLGGLPLLISQMVGVMDRLRLSYTEFLDLLEESGIENVNKTGSSTSQSQQMYSISSKLGLDGLSSKSRGLLQMISLLDPDRIPEKILIGACSQTTIENFPETRAEYYQARAQLLQSSLINYKPETGEIWLHRVVQDIARDGMRKSRLASTFETAVRAVSKVWPFGELVARFNTERYIECANIFPTIVRLKNAHEVVFKEQKCTEIDIVAALYNDAGWYWFERGFPQEAKEFFMLIEHICEQLENKSAPGITYQLRRANLNQGTASMETNDGEECLMRYKKWLETSLETQPSPEDVEFGYELACIYNETGVAYAMNENYEDAITYFLKSIESFQELSNYNDTMLNWPEPNLGFMYWVQGKYDEAERVLTEILEIHEVAYGIDDTESFKTGKILYALGNVYVSQGLFDKGFIFHTRCLEQYRATLGNDHHRVGDICVRLADHNIRLKNFPEADKFIKKALKIFSSRPYYKHEMARATFKQGQMFKAMGKEATTIKNFQQAFNLRRSLLPKDKRPIDELTEKDYDNLVIFWSR